MSLKPVRLHDSEESHYKKIVEEINKSNKIVLRISKYHFMERLFQEIDTSKIVELYFQKEENYRVLIDGEKFPDLKILSLHCPYYVKSPFKQDLEELYINLSCDMALHRLGNFDLIELEITNPNINTEIINMVMHELAWYNGSLYIANFTNIPLDNHIECIPCKTYYFEDFNDIYRKLDKPIIPTRQKSARN